MWPSNELFQMNNNNNDPDESAALFDNTLRSLLDRHAPVKQRNITIRPCVPWMNDEIILAKRQRRKAERKWRASKAHIDLLSYRTMRNRVTLLSNKARSDYYTNFIIENSTDQRRLFRASKSLLNLSKGSGLPLSTNDYQMANDFGKFFAQKIADISNLFPVFQSAYGQNHSTETALIKVMNDILLNMNNQRVTLLILLDLSAAFDTVDHDTMLRRLEHSFGLQGKALSWFASYLSGRTQRIMINESLSRPFRLECGVPQGSCLGPLLFTLYTSELFEIIKYHLPMIHCYADDSQVYISFSPNDRAEQLAVVKNLEDCIRDIRFWMLNNGLKLNDDKTEFLIIGTSQQLGKLDNISIRVGDSNIHPVPIARNLGSWFDSRLSMATHITKICASSFYYIYNIRRIRKYLTQQSTETLVHAFVTSRLDYCNGLLYGLPDCLLNKLQRVQNACARLIFKEQKFCRVTPLFYELHWLPIKYRIEFKILLITFKILNFLAPTYLSSLISHRLPSKYNLRNSSDKFLLSYPLFKSKATLGDRSFTCAAPKLWNVLPLDIRSASTVSSFKAKLKTHLFRRAFLT